MDSFSNDTHFSLLTAKKAFMTRLGIDTSKVHI